MIYDGFYVSMCICMYLYVSICIYMYLYVSICIYIYLHMYLHMYLIYVLYVSNSMAMTQEPIDWSYRFHICLAYFSGLCKGIYPQHMARNMVLTYLHFRILEFPLIYVSMYLHIYEYL